MKLIEIATPTLPDKPIPNFLKKKKVKNPKPDTLSKSVYGVGGWYNIPFTGTGGEGEGGGDGGGGE